RLARAFRPGILGIDAVRAEQPVLGIESVLRSLRSRVSAYVRIADADDELLEQLRAASVPREADPADDRQCIGRQVAARVWRWPQRPGLALRRRSLQRHPRRARARTTRRDLQRRWWRRDGE